VDSWAENTPGEFFHFYIALLAHSLNHAAPVEARRSVPEEQGLLDLLNMVAHSKLATTANQQTNLNQEADQGKNGAWEVGEDSGCHDEGYVSRAGRASHSEWKGRLNNIVSFGNESAPFHGGVWQQNSRCGMDAQSNANGQAERPSSAQARSSIRSGFPSNSRPSSATSARPLPVALSVSWREYWKNDRAEANTIFPVEQVAGSALWWQRSLAQTTGTGSY
jgi:hypothetical protein